MGRAKQTLTLVVLALAVTACAAHSSGGSSSKTQPVTVTALPSNLSAPATRDPQVVIDALDATGLALCHSAYSDAAQYNVFAVLGASATWRFFPLHTAVLVKADNASVLSCVTSNQPDTGAIEIDVFPSAADASAALHHVGHIWPDAWIYGNVVVLVDQTTPPIIAQEEVQVLDRLPGIAQIP